jgi:outer membrane protein insertion porin family
MTRGLIYLLLISVLASGCTGMKNIPASDPLYTGHEVKFKEKNKNTGKLSQTVEGVLKPAPNSTLLWMRPALARYNMLSEKGRKKKFWKSKIATPVLLSATKPSEIASAIQNRLFHNGYFHNSVAYDTVPDGSRKAKYIYTVTLQDPYRFESVLFPKPENDLTEKINSYQEGSLLKPGDIYTLDAIKGERARIDRNLKENGYLYFNPEFLTIKADSVSGDHLVRARLAVKPETPEESRRAYHVGKVTIFNEHGLENMPVDTTKFGNYYLVSPHESLRFDALKQGIFLKPGELYAHSNVMHTIRYMNDLPIIRNANIRFSPRANTDSLDVMLYLNQRKRYAYTAEFNAIFRSTNYFGPGMIFSYTDRNLKKGSEMLKVNLRGRVEAQVVDGDGNAAYEVGVEVNYRLPRLYPAFLFPSGQKSLPKTNISVGYNLFYRLDLYRLNSLFLNFGYRWRKSEKVSHSFNPVEIIFTQIPEETKSTEFLEYLEENPGVQRSFDEQFIVGSGYEFEYRPLVTGRNEFFFRGGLDMAGNLIAAFYEMSNATRDSLGRYTLLGVPYSQYARIRVDLRNGHSFRKSKLVTRFSAGIGVPLGNSNILPYIKQFYVGGTNSLRSFVARSVGPGSEVPPDGYNDLTGDIRFEANAEYRFNVSGNLKGALFVDAGNIWLYSEDESRPNGTFHLDTFLDEIAVSGGWGVRWDFDFIVARLDFAYTLRTPYLVDGEKWASSINPWNPALNIAIGYPF